MNKKQACRNSMSTIISGIVDIGTLYIPLASPFQRNSFLDFEITWTDFRKKTVHVAFQRNESARNLGYRLSAFDFACRRRRKDWVLCTLGSNNFKLNSSTMATTNSHSHSSSRTSYTRPKLLRSCVTAPTLVVSYASRNDRSSPTFAATGLHSPSKDKATTLLNRVASYSCGYSEKLEDRLQQVASVEKRIITGPPVTRRETAEKSGSGGKSGKAILFSHFMLYYWFQRFIGAYFSFPEFEGYSEEQESNYRDNTARRNTYRWLSINISFLRIEASYPPGVTDDNCEKSYSLGQRPPRLLSASSHSSMTAEEGDLRSTYVLDGYGNPRPCYPFWYGQKPVA